MKKIIWGLAAIVVLSLGVWGIGSANKTVPVSYSLLAWNDLGMHCMDDDYSVFSILPPYNNLHAQLINRQTGKAVTTGVTITYEATEDTRGSLNSTSLGKSNFWDYALYLFGVLLPMNTGLTGSTTPGPAPASLTYDAVKGFWKADGVPVIPYDDTMAANYYPMVQVVAKDLKGNILATTKVVLPVSDEINCSHCHTSGIGDPMAQPAPDWVYDSNPKKDWRRNILLLHDNKNLTNPVYVNALAQTGYNAGGLLPTSDGGKPILCASCHASNALGTAGAAGVRQLTTSVHSWHAVMAMDDNTGMPMDMTLNRTVCYYCHPGSTTQCLRGVMGSAKNPDGTDKLECQSCHGVMSKVGAPDRQGWLDLPKCQNCHYKGEDGNYVQDVSGFDATGNFREATSIFSTGSALYKLGATHGKMQCESCHGSTHAEYATTEANDNVQSLDLQGHTGTVAECTVCHVQTPPALGDNGPHGLHTLGKLWLLPHAGAAKADMAKCQACHGVDYRGTRLSRTFAARSFFVKGKGLVKKSYITGEVVSCFDCHKTL